MKSLLIITLTLLSTTIFGQKESFTEYDSLRVVELAKEIEELRGDNQKNEAAYNESYRLYIENQKVINIKYAEKQNKLNALLEKKKGKEK